MQSVIQKLEAKYAKPSVVDVRSGDTVKVHQRIKEGDKSRTQIFEGMVIRTKRKDQHTSSITVRRIASGIGVEKTYLLHSPLVLKVEVTKRSKVRRKNLSYMRNLSGKAARLTGVDFDRRAVNDTTVDEPAPVAKEKAEDVTEKPEPGSEAEESPERPEVAPETPQEDTPAS